MKGLYVHIPFCLTRCHYCNFITTADSSRTSRARFFSALQKEVDYIQKKYPHLVFDTFYLGGGSPSILTIPELEQLVLMLRKAFEFRKGHEFSFEFNPGDGDQEKIKTLKKLGVNRISLGAQAFQDSLLKTLGRRHAVKDIKSSVKKIRDAGIDHISFDLMLRIPGQTPEDFQRSLKACIALKASQISLYDLEVHPHTVFGEAFKKGKLDLPSEEEHAQMYEAAIHRLCKAGYEHYEVSNFAKPGLASRHNLIYWHNQEYLGLGPGAFSYLEGVRSQFASDLDRYLKKCEAENWEWDSEDVLSAEDIEKETLVTGLRLQEGVKIGRASCRERV